MTFKFALLLIVSPLLVSLPPLPFALSLLIVIPAIYLGASSLFFVGATLLFVALVVLITLPLNLLVTSLFLLLALVVRLPLPFGAFLLLSLTTRFLSLAALLPRLLIVPTLFLCLIVIASLFVSLTTLFPSLISLWAPRVLSLVAVARVLRLCNAGQAQGCTDTETESYQNGSQLTGSHKGPPCVN
ncbi:MAG: hypothetical protein ACT4OT_05465 [Acidobacteriota bacterium]